MEKVIFYLLAVLMIAGAIASVSSRRMLRSVIYLLFVLLGVAGIYFMIDYNFLGAIQLTVYAGGIIVLIIFSVLLVHHIEMETEAVSRSRMGTVGLACLLGLGTFLSVIHNHSFLEKGIQAPTTVEEIGHGLLSYAPGGFILPFEVISILLLAAMVGAIIIAKGSKSIDKSQTKP